MPTTTTRKGPTVRRAEDGYALWGMEPPELVQSHGIFRKMFWGWVVEFGLKAKDRDLAKGIGANGKLLADISEYTRKHRRSAMTPSGKGDPNAPPLTPGWQKSRTRSLLTGRAYEDHADFFWKFDPFTHDSWSKILEYQAEVGRDVFGLSPKGLLSTQRQAIARWNAYKKGKYDEPEPRKPQRPPEERPEDMIVGTFGFRGRNIAEWEAYFRQTAPARLVGRPLTPKVKSPISGPKYNVLLAHMHGAVVEGPPRAKITAMIPPKPKPPKPAPKTAAKPKPKPPPIPPPKPTPAPAPAPVAARPFHDLVLEAIELVPESQLWGSDAAFIHHVWEEYQKLPGAQRMTLEQFKHKAVYHDLLRGRMHRADLVHGMREEDIRASHTEYKIGSMIVATFNFLRRAISK